MHPAGMPLPLRVALLSAVLALASCTSSTPAPAPAPPAAKTIAGPLLEKLDGPPYSYLRLGTGGDGTWVAIPVTSIAKDERVSAINCVPLRNYGAPQLSRRFEVVHFCTLRWRFNSWPRRRDFDT